MLKKARKILVAGLVMAMTSTMFAGFASAKAATVNLTLWGAQNDQVMLKQMVEKFKKANPKKTYNVKIGVCGEDVAKDTILKDIDTAADVFAFASDQIAALQGAGALMPVTINTKDIKTRNTAASVNASSIGGQLYAYPSSSDTFFLYYDKKYFKDADVKSLEKMMAKKLPTGVTNFAMAMNNGWYMSAFFFAAGAQLFGPSGTDPTKCDFNSAKGVAAGKYMLGLAAQDGKFKDYGANYDSSICQNFKDRKLAAAVSGTWNAAAIQAALGKDYAATKLPTIKINGKDSNMGSFANFKLYGVNSHSKNAADALALADWLTNQNSQLIRFQMRSFAPTNVDLAKHTQVLNMNIAVGACAKQGKFATLQPSIKQMNNYWGPSGAFGTSVENGKTTEATLQSDLDKFVQQILAKTE